jgi:hypothetical protein
MERIVNIKMFLILEFFFFANSLDFDGAVPRSLRRQFIGMLVERCLSPRHCASNALNPVR